MLYMGSMPSAAHYLNLFTVYITRCLVRFTKRSLVKPPAVYSVLHFKRPFLKLTCDFEIAIAEIAIAGSETHSAAVV
jgi:hypothetical protein